MFAVFLGVSSYLEKDELIVEFPSQLIKYRLFGLGASQPKASGASVTGLQTTADV